MNLGRLLNQEAVYWTPLSVGGDGNTIYSPGVQVAVRWQSKREQITNAQGNKEFSQAIIYFDRAALTVDINGRWYQGALTDLTAGQIANPTTLNGAYQIKQFGDSPSVGNSQGMGQAWL
jgi:hypothetical protein